MKIRRIETRWLRAFLFPLWSMLAAIGGAASAQQPQSSDQDLEVQTRGPVHEAFADLVTFDPEPNREITRPPPAAVEELPPEERPAGNESIWISGYWAFDDETSDFLWVSGVWRVPPPAHSWVPGYWNRTSGGFTWVQGFWLPEQTGGAGEVTYYATPPENLETGPSSPQPSDGYVWSPGCWTWRESRYLWRPGNWFEANPDWVWIPAQYHWTPGGSVFVEGHWDYLLDRRGVLYAPVVFHRPFGFAGVYRYRPTVAIDLGVLSLHLFSRPRYGHYYFGDWYAPNYWEQGIYPTFAFNMSAYGYDPVFQHRRWEHRGDEHQWESSVHDDFHRYRDDERSRPPRTYRGQETARRERDDEDRRDGGKSREGRDDRRENIVMARPVKDLAQRPDARLRLEPVPEHDRAENAASEARRVEASVARATTEHAVADRRTASKERGAEPERAVLKRESPVLRSVPRAKPPALPEASKARGGEKDENARQPVDRSGRKDAPKTDGERAERPTGKPEEKPAGRAADPKKPGGGDDRPEPKPAGRRMDQPDAPTPPKPRQPSPERKPDPAPKPPGRDPAPNPPGREAVKPRPRPEPQLLPRRTPTPRADKPAPEPRKPATPRGKPGGGGRGGGAADEDKGGNARGRSRRMDADG